MHPEMSDLMDNTLSQEQKKGLRITPLVNSQAYLFSRLSNNGGIKETPEISIVYQLSQLPNAFIQVIQFFFYSIWIVAI